MSKDNYKITSLASAVSLGVASIIGSGWLFAPYFAAKYSGSLSLFSWILAALICLILALMLSELTSLYPVRGLVSRLFSLSHNRDLGFIISSSYWVSTILFAPAEAQATVQYLSFLFPQFQKIVLDYDTFTNIGYLIMVILIVIYCLINYWGIKIMSKVSNIITLFKLIVPISTAIILMCTTFHFNNFVSYKNTFAPYGASSIFTTVIYGGVFYSFLGFTSMASFVAEIKNPQRNIPIALTLSIIICLSIYLVLQVAYIAAVPPSMLINGWYNVFFTSPLIQLILLFNLNFWAIILYVDAFVSPSSAALIIVATSSRALSSMAEDKQLPKFLAHAHPKFNFSRISLFITMLSCIAVIIFLKTWHEVIIVITSLQLLTYISIPLSLAKLRSNNNLSEGFRLKGAKFLCFVIFLIISYLLTKAGFKQTLYTLILNLILFSIYLFGSYKLNFKKILNGVLSSWSLLSYLIIITLFNYIDLKYKVNSTLEIILFLVFGIFSYLAILYQKDYSS